MGNELNKFAPSPLEKDEFAIQVGAFFTNSSRTASFVINTDGSINVTLNLSFKLEDPKANLLAEVGKVPTFDAYGLFNAKTTAIGLQKISVDNFFLKVSPGDQGKVALLTNTGEVILATNGEKREHDSVYLKDLFLK